MYDPVEGQISDVRGYDQKKIEVLGFGLSFPVSFFSFRGMAAVEIPRHIPLHIAEFFIWTGMKLKNMVRDC